jgi:hypothetical protein
MIRYWLVLILAAVTLMGDVACRRRQARPVPGVPYDSGTTSPKLSTFVFKEESKFYLMTVGVNAIRMHDGDEYVPLSVTVVNRSVKPMVIYRESFTLVDPISGARYGLAGVAEVRRQGKQLYDRKLMDVEHLASKLSPYTRIPSNFFPSQQLVRDQIELHQFHFMIDNLYFPRPEGELLGKTFELHLDAKGLENPLFVVFTVPEA